MGYLGSVSLATQIYNITSEKKFTVLQNVRSISKMLDILERFHFFLLHIPHGFDNVGQNELILLTFLLCVILGVNG